MYILTFVFPIIAVLSSACVGACLFMIYKAQCVIVGSRYEQTAKLAVLASLILDVPGFFVFFHLLQWWCGCARWLSFFGSLPLIFASVSAALLLKIIPGRKNRQYYASILCAAVSLVTLAIPAFIIGFDDGWLAYVLTFVLELFAAVILIIFAVGISSGSLARKRMAELAAEGRLPDFSAPVREKAPVCAKCGSPLPAGAAFCHDCGAPVNAQPNRSVSDTPAAASADVNPKAETDIFDAIENLAQLRTAGVITEEEFDRKKAELIAKL